MVLGGKKKRRAATIYSTEEAVYLGREEEERIRYERGGKNSSRGEGEIPHRRP